MTEGEGLALGPSWLYPLKTVVTRTRSALWLVRARGSAAGDGARILFYHRVSDDRDVLSVAPLAFYERLAELAERHDFAVASDEAYTELWFDKPPVSALQVADRSRMIVFQTLSKRSSMTGYRSGFVAAPPGLISALKAYRPNAGTAPQEFVQRASIVAWGDERHVEDTRARYAAKRAALMPVLAAKNWEVVASDATMYLWVSIPTGETAEAVAERLLPHGLLISPGTFFGPSGEGYIRFALVPTLAECERAATILQEAL